MSTPSPAGTKKSGCGGGLGRFDGEGGGGGLRRPTGDGVGGGLPWSDSEGGGGGLRRPIGEFKSGRTGVGLDSFNGVLFPCDRVAGRRPTGDGVGGVRFARNLGILLRALAFPSRF